MLTGRGVVAALLGCGLLGLNSVLLADFYAARIGWQQALGTHLALAFVTALPGVRRRRGGRRRVEWLHLAAWMLLLGPFGVLIGMTLFLPRTHAEDGTAPQRPAMPDDGAEATPGRLELLRNDLMDGRLRLGGGHLIRPLLDVIIEGETTEKLDALGLVAKRYVPGFAPVLRRALQDADSSVRVLAATVAAQLHNSHTRRIGALQDAAQAMPTPEAWRALGEARLAYAASGLLEADRAKREADEGRGCLMHADAPDPAQPPEPESEGEAADGTLVAA